MKMVNKAAGVAGMVGDITRTCARSFFCGAASRGQRRRRMWMIAAVTLCVTLVISTALVGARFSLAVYYNGEEVGAAKSITEVPKIVASAESQLTELLGYEYSLGDAVSVEPSVSDAASLGDIEKNIILSVDGVDELYTVMVGGEVVAASEDSELLYRVLQEILASYTTENTISVQFLEDVRISRAFVTEDIPRGEDEIRELLSPENAGGLLTVESSESLQRDEAAPYDTEYSDDDTLYEGETLVITAGAIGSKRVTEEITLINGVETSRKDSGSVIIQEPVTEVIARGTMPRPKTASYGEYIWPTEGVVTSFFGYRSTSVGSSNHKGLDIAGFTGQEIYAADGGKVTFAEYSGGYGLVVIILHDNGEETVYGHCSKLYVSAGESVYQGQLIAAMGRTGVASGVHCHFEIRIDGKQIDPLTRLGASER